MIAYIDGKIAYKEPAYVILDVQGIGYQIRISLQTFTTLGALEARCKLYTYLQIKEDAHTLYGFAEAAEKKVFLDLISVSGIGANTALLMLSSLSTAELTHAIATEDLRVIQGVKGIGRKTAERLIVELKDKIQRGEATTLPELSPNNFRQNKAEAVAALVALGIAKTTAEKNIEQIMRTHGADLRIEELIKLALNV
ncbi:Holliday junction branch migration protein RuvA [Eisenibacter elegans]|jgi:Holliday junction DNA helicase RuvA|uniref:Holliday junction branch migration protein RuvA n=1 Tax=Eisenibacter elegans TaxID=997 RepID=UPI0003F4D44F|nr:Holliday junction branch migration protein RuvA [Eisenibacter elegans]